MIPYNTHAAQEYKYNIWILKMNLLQCNTTTWLCPCLFYEIDHFMFSGYITAKSTVRIITSAALAAVNFLRLALLLQTLHYRCQQSLNKCFSYKGRHQGRFVVHLIWDWTQKQVKTKFFFELIINATFLYILTSWSACGWGSYKWTKLILNLDV